MARQGFKSSSRNKRKIEVLHFKEANGFDTAQSGDERGTTHACWSTSEAVQRGLAFSCRNLQ